MTQPRSDTDDRFDTPRITAAIDELAAKHAGREDVFRAAVALLLAGIGLCPLGRA